jgi:hypothetical protein
MGLPGEPSVKVDAEVFNRFDLRDVCAVYIYWGALAPAEWKRDVGRLCFIYLEKLRDIIWLNLITYCHIMTLELELCGSNGSVVIWVINTNSYIPRISQNFALHKKFDIANSVTAKSEATDLISERLAMKFTVLKSWDAFSVSFLEIYVVVCRHMIFYINR